MMRYLLLFTISILLFVSCKEQEQPPLPRETMMSVLEDIHMAEVYSSMVNSGEERTTNKNIDSLVKFYNIIFDTHGITLEEFNTSTDWYANHPKELDSVYTNMLPALNELDGVLMKNNSEQ